jgi:formylglycine-generating enzyme required for sulfatase activity
MNAVDADIPERLKNSAHLPMQSVMSTCATILSEDYGITAELAFWSVGTWALALRVISAKDLSSLDPLMTEPTKKPQIITPNTPQGNIVQKKEIAIGNVKMTFVYIQPGKFMMGSPEREKGRSNSETQHEVMLTKGFYMQTTPVTQAQWKAEMGDNPSYFKGCDNCPVDNVSWHDAQKFIETLNNKEGKSVYRLPTEAEWEYACRAGTKTPFAFGECLSTDDANYDGNYPLEGCPKGQYRKKTTPVGSFRSNAWGLYDMHGNVREWCADWYGAYPSSSIVDPVGPNGGLSRVLRGGSWNNRGQSCRSAFRNRYYPDFRYDNYGFRLVLSVGQM